MDMSGILPDMPETQIKMPSYDDMVKTGMHFGRKRTVFHPNMKSSVYTMKDNIYIIDLLKTEQAIKSAVSAMKKVIETSGKILFVGLTVQSSDIVKEIAEDLKMPYVINRWLGGTFTNFKTINGRVKYLIDAEKEKETGGLEKYTKLERLKKTREIEKLKSRFDGLRFMVKLPEMVFTTSIRESQNLVNESRRVGVQIVGINNTDSDPMKIDYPIPANDNSKKSVELILRTIQSELKNVEIKKASDSVK